MKWFRPYLTVLLTVAITVGFFLDRIQSESFFGFATGVIVWWMKSRDEEKHNGGSK